MRSPAADRLASGRRAELWLGTLVDVAAEAPSPAAVEAGIAAAFATIAHIHRALSNHDPGSELARVNRRAARRETAISRELHDVLACALAVAARSGGAFDPAQGGRMAALGLLPLQAPAQLGASWRDVHLGPRRVAFARPLALDFGGIAKGYAVDRAVDALRAHGVAAGCVNAGGDLRVFGPRDERVHLRTGGSQPRLVPLAVVSDGAIATSAYARDATPARVSPLLDPQRGLPRASRRTVSVVAPTCMVADALTKVVALRGRGAAATIAAFDASAIALSPVSGRWRCTRIPQSGGGATAVP